MTNFIKKIMFFLLSMQEKMLTKKLAPHLKTSFTSSTTRTVMTKDCTLNLTVQTEQNKLKLQNNVAIIVKNAQNDPEKLLDYIKNNGTEVIRHKNAKKVLDLINEEEGLIIGLKGINALILNVLLKFKFSLKSTTIFVLSLGKIDEYYMIHQFYKWYAMKMRLPGFEEDAQENFKKYAIEGFQNTAELNLNDILSLKEAIARDVEAIQFVEDLAKSSEGSKNALKKLTDGGANI